MKKRLSVILAILLIVVVGDYCLAKLNTEKYEEGAIVTKSNQYGMTVLTGGLLPSSITSDTYLAKGTYTITHDLVIDHGVTLTVEAGTVINVNENLVALKTNAESYHFVPRVDDVWYSKMGSSPVVKNLPEDMVNGDTWDDVSQNSVTGEIVTLQKNLFTSKTVYFAIKKDWSNKYEKK